MPEISTDQPIPPDLETYKFARGYACDEVAYRREHQWRVFTWTSGLFSAGMAALLAAHSTGQHLAVPEKWVLAVIVAIFGLGTIERLRHDFAIMREWLRRLRVWDTHFGLPTDDQSGKGVTLGDQSFIVALALATLIIIVLL